MESQLRGFAGSGRSESRVREPVGENERFPGADAAARAEDNKRKGLAGYRICLRARLQEPGSGVPERRGRIIRSLSWTSIDTPIRSTDVPL